MGARCTVGEPREGVPGMLIFILFLFYFLSLLGGRRVSTYSQYNEHLPAYLPTYLQ